MSEDGFQFWPRCPDCGDCGVSCVRRDPPNAVPAEVYGFVCREGHSFDASHKAIMGVQRQRQKERPCK